MSYRELHNRLNGRLTAATVPAAPAAGRGGFSYEGAKTQRGSNHWSSTEYNRNNARNVNFGSGNTNNNNKYNGYVIRPVSAYGDYVPAPFLASVLEAYADCLRGKSRSRQAVEYMKQADEDIPRLAWELWTGEYKPGTSTCFLVRYPKLREVFAAGFRDRIVHHWICLRLEPLFEERFVSQGNVSFNCRKGFGTDKAVKHVAEGMSRVSDNYHREAWVFRGDLVGFFMSIDKQLLWYRLERFIRRRFKGAYKDILTLTAWKVVMHHPERNCVLNTEPKEWANLAPNKSLFTSPTGEPIGNLTTQLFANFLMSYFVSYVQWLYRGKNYCFAQFVDDFIIVCDDLQYLIGSIPKIARYLKEKMLLTMHTDKRYLQPVSHGILFVGSYIKPGRLYLSNRTLARMKEHCEGFGKLLEDGDVAQQDLEHIEQVMNSYLGFTRRRETYDFRRQCIEAMGSGFWNYFYVKGHFESIRRKRLTIETIQDNDEQSNLPSTPA